MKAIWHGTVLAESDKAREVGGYHYFPRGAVNMKLLQPAPKDEDDLD